MSDIFYGPGGLRPQPPTLESMVGPERAPVTLDEFQADAMATTPNALQGDDRLNFFAHALAEEFGEVYKLLSKYLRNGKPIDPAIVADELGDVLDVITVLADTLGLKMDDIARANMRKRDKWRK